PYTALSNGWYPRSHTAVLILVPAALLGSAAAVVVRLAGSSGAERLQLKWFVTAAVLVVAAIIPLSLDPQIGLSPAATRTGPRTSKTIYRRVDAAAIVLANTATPPAAPSEDAGYDAAHAA